MKMDNLAMKPLLAGGVLFYNRKIGYFNFTIEHGLKILDQDEAKYLDFVKLRKQINDNIEDLLCKV
jgi:hypothetical protein